MKQLDGIGICVGHRGLIGPRERNVTVHRLLLAPDVKYVPAKAGIGGFFSLFALKEPALSEISLP